MNLKGWQNSNSVLNYEWGKLIDQMRYKRVIYLSFAIGMVGLAHYLNTINHMFGLPILWLDPSMVRIAQSTESFSTSFGRTGYFLLYFNIFTVIIVSIYITISKSIRKNKLISSLGIVALIGTLLLAQRTYFFAAILISFFIYINFRNFKPQEQFSVRFVIGLSFLVSVLFIVFVSIAELLGKDARRHLTTIHLPAFMTPLLSPYVYFTGTIPAFQEYIHDIHSFTFGSNLFLPITKVIAIFVPTVHVPPEITPYYQIPFRFNAITYLSVFYHDFGLFGIIIGPFLIGMLSTYLYFYILYKPTLPLIFLNGMMEYVLIYSVFNSRLVTTYVWMISILGYFFFKWVTKDNYI